MSDHTIKRTRGADVGVEPPFKDAESAITPGELLEIIANGNLQAHSTAGGNSARIIALEDANREAPSGTKQIDHDYAAGDSVKHIYARRGGLFYMFLADGHSVAEGAELESDGAGALQPFGTAAEATPANTDNIVAYAAEDLDTTGGAAARERILVRIA